MDDKIGYVDLTADSSDSDGGDIGHGEPEIHHHDADPGFRYDAVTDDGLEQLLLEEVGPDKRSHKTAKLLYHLHQFFNATPGITVLPTGGVRFTPTALTQFQAMFGKQEHKWLNVNYGAFKVYLKRLGFLESDDSLTWAHKWFTPDGSKLIAILNGEEKNLPSDPNYSMKKPPAQLVASSSGSSPILDAQPRYISSHWTGQALNSILQQGIQICAPKLPFGTAVVVFSSPFYGFLMNGFLLRFTINGDTVAHMLEFCNVKVHRRSHVIDMGLQVGMLMEYLFDESIDINGIKKLSVGRFQQLLLASKSKFYEDPSFQKRAREATVHLQQGVSNYREVWSAICEICRQDYNLIYKRLRVSLEQKGVSFYNPHVLDVLNALVSQGLTWKSDKGALYTIIEGKKVLLVKSDGSYKYNATSLTALWYRLNVEKAEWIVYISTPGDVQDYKMCVNAARCAGWLPRDENRFPRADYIEMDFCHVDDGRPRGIAWFDELTEQCVAALSGRAKENEWSTDDLREIAQAMAVGAFKYWNLNNTSKTTHTVSPHQILDPEGNTAVRLLFAHARIFSIIRTSDEHMVEFQKTGTIKLDHAEERLLAHVLVQFPEDACLTLKPKVLCSYLCNLEQLFTRCYDAPEGEITTMLLLCEATSAVMIKCFELLGIVPLTTYGDKFLI